MSGPKTVVISADPFAVLLSAAAIRAALAVREGHQRAQALKERHDAAQQGRSDQLREARREGARTLALEVAAAEGRLEELARLSGPLTSVERVRDARPPRPSADDSDAQAGYLSALQSLARDLENMLLTENARQKPDTESAPPELAIPQGATPLKLSQKLLERIAHLGAPPAAIAALADELDGVGPGERFDLLALELRRRIQLHAEQHHEHQLEQATALIVEQSLKDLGYQVEDIPDTLFVEGGVAHFRRRDWGEYMVRMRVDAQDGAANFNVVRATAAAGVGAEPAGDGLADHLAEDRWCAEFPRLLKTLEARGARVHVTRRLAPGELPVQRVAREKLPRFDEAGEEQTPAASRLQTLK